MSQHFAFAFPSDVIDATYSGDGLTSSGTDYPFSAMGDREPSNVFIALEDDGRVIANAGAKVEVQGIFLGHHRYTEARTLHLQANDDNDWTGVQPLDETIIVPPWHRDGFAYHLWWDIATRVPVLADRQWNYWSIVPDAPNDDPIGIGLFTLLGTVRRLQRNIAWKPVSRLSHGEIRNATKFGVHSVYETRDRARGIDCTVPQGDDTTRHQLTELREDARSGNRPFFICPGGSEDASNPLHEPMWAEWAGDTLAQTHEFLNLHSASISFDELSCGKPY